MKFEECNDLKTLSRKIDSALYKCERCSQYQLVFKNLVIELSKDELEYLLETLIPFEKAGYFEKDANGKQIAIKCTSIVNIRFLFDLREISLLINLISEGLIIDSVYKTLNSNCKTN